MREKNVFVQKRLNEGAFAMLLSASIYILLLLWAILFKFSRISEIHIGSSMTLTERILNGTRLFDFFLETSPKRFWHECMVAFCNILLFVPMGIYASFFCKAARAIAIGCVFSCVLEGIQLFANFGVFSFEDILLNTVGAVIGAFFYQVLVRRIPEGFVKKANWCIIVIGTPITVFAYITVINAIILYFS